MYYMLEVTASGDRLTIMLDHVFPLGRFRDGNHPAFPFSLSAPITDKVSLIPINNILLFFRSYIVTVSLRAGYPQTNLNSSPPL